MSDKYSTIRQHEPLRVPDGWGAKEKRLIAQLEEILDDIYSRFGRLKITDMSKPLQNDIEKAANATFEIEHLEDGLKAKADKTTVDGQFATMQKQTAEALLTKASSEARNELTGRVEKNETSIVTNAKGITALVEGDTPAGAVSTTTVTVNKNGFHLNTDGTFTVDSGNFSLDGEGNMSCSGASINGELLNNGQKVYTPLDIYIGTVEPLNPRAGMVWIRPKQSTTVSTSQTTHTYTYDRDRMGLASNPVYGTMVGPAATAAGTKYTYEIDIPVYIGGNVSGATVTIDIGGTVFTGSVSGKLYDHRTVHIEAEASRWLAGSGSLNFILSASSNNVLSDRAGQYAIKLVSRSTSE